ncbi:hypothetical protein [Bacillus atrophaeus]|uniref:hypothetical protein n=1 Tax=Bacillus atrophaeus TaxID=1452 RepID=UPI001C62A7C9|nr:hypothetical protein [Bacillus atrophaeus]QYG88295.1 hypothetical protein HCU65_07305 [Bacillus atrophaeus]
MNPTFSFDDLVAVDGYLGRIFYVDSWREVKEHEEWGVSEYVEYSLTDAINGEWLEAFDTDLRLVCRKENAEDYLMAFDMTDYPKAASAAVHWTDYFIGIDRAEEAVEVAKETSKTARQISAQEVAKRKRATDTLLDEYNDYMRLYAAFGDAEYKTKADGVLAKMRREAGD